MIDLILDAGAVAQLSIDRQHGITVGATPANCRRRRLRCAICFPLV